LRHTPARGFGSRQRISVNVQSVKISVPGQRSTKCFVPCGTGREVEGAI
jgi:hypothetical protein